jgi:hypothetical protein
MKTSREVRNAKKIKSQLKTKSLGKVRTLALSTNHNQSLVRIA